MFSGTRRPVRVMICRLRVCRNDIYIGFLNSYHVECLKIRTIFITRKGNRLIAVLRLRNVIDVGYYDVGKDVRAAKGGEKPQQNRSIISEQWKWRNARLL